MASQLVQLAAVRAQRICTATQHSPVPQRWPANFALTSAYLMHHCCLLKALKHRHQVLLQPSICLCVLIINSICFSASKRLLQQQLQQLHNSRHCWCTALAPAVGCSALG